MKKIALIGAMTALAIPGTALAQDAPAPDAKTNASQACKSERAKMGASAFKLLYGTNRNRSNAFGKCVSRRTRSEAANIKQAKSTCKAQQSDPNFAASHGGKTFQQFYGTNKNGRNAYGKCVSQQAKEESKADTAKTVNAAKACKAERAEIGREAFARKYGTNKNRRNAFGQCVSARAKEYSLPS